MIEITPTRLHWIGDDGEDDSGDYCAHSPVEMTVGEQVVIAPDAGDWTVSASAIILLRSLFRNHLTDMRTEEHVFPCCGHGMWPKKGGGVVIGGCPNGIDFSIRHKPPMVELVFETGAYEVEFSLWRSAVIKFSGLVQGFYDGSCPKDLSPDAEPEGFLAMMEEWRDLRARAESPLLGSPDV